MTDTVTVSRQVARQIMRKQAKAQRVTPAEAARRRLVEAKAERKLALARAADMARLTSPHVAARERREWT
jgi:hypothetical protein